MTVNLRADFEKYVEEQVKAGRYPTANDVVEHALSRLMEEEFVEEIDDATYAALLESEEQVKRGKFYTLEEVREMFRKEGDESYAALLRSHEQSLRGEGIPVTEARRQIQLESAAAKNGLALSKRR